MLKLTKAQARKMNIVVGPEGAPARSSPARKPSALDPRAKAAARAQLRRAASIHLRNLPEPERGSCIKVEVLGRPMPKEASRRDGEGKWYKPQKTHRYERRVRDEAVIAMRGMRPMTGPVRLTIIHYRALPVSMPKRDHEDAIAGQILPDTKPDIDNIQKSLLDGLKTVIIEDDGQICDLVIRKRFARVEKVVFSVRALKKNGIRIPILSA